MKDGIRMMDTPSNSAISHNVENKGTVRFNAVSRVDSEMDPTLDGFAQIGRFGNLESEGAVDW
jgi:hypothetical protein